MQDAKGKEQQKSSPALMSTNSCSGQYGKVIQNVQ